MDNIKTNNFQKLKTKFIKILKNDSNDINKKNEHYTFWEVIKNVNQLLQMLNGTYDFVIFQVESSRIKECKSLSNFLILFLYLQFDK